MPGKKSGFLLLLLSLTVSFFYSCEFEPHKVYERTVIENVTAPEIQIVELNLNYDTIFLYTQKQIRFNFTSSNQEILAVRFTIDNDEKYLVNTNKGVFELDYRIITNGIHTMVLELYTASGSGSIAEHLGVEGYLFSNSWVLYVDQNYSYNVKSIIADGFLKLTWNRYRGYDFKEYAVYRQTGWDSKILISKSTVPYFTDQTYVGEATNYYVEVITHDGLVIPWGSLELVKDLPKLYFIVSEGNQYLVKWNKSKYYGAVETTTLSLSTNWGIDYTAIKVTSEPEDTSHFLTSLYFGDRIVLKLNTVPINKIFYNPVNYSLYESYLTDLTVGFHFGMKNRGVYNITQVSRDEFIFIAGCDSLTRYSVSQKRIVERFGYQPIGCSMCNFSSLKVSPSGKYLTTYVDCDHDIMLVNSGNLANHTVRDLKSLTGQMYIPEIPVSDAGLVIVNNSNGGFYLYNFNTATTIAFYNKDVFTLQGLSISLNGDYIFLLHDSLRLVRYYNSEFINIWSHSRFAEPEFYEFDGINPDRLVIWNDSNLSIKQCADFSTVYEFPLADGKILDIDYYNNRILTWSSGHLFVRSLTDGSLLNDVPYRLDPGFWYNSCYLIDRAIVSQLGVIYFLE